jgi:hypothetical protein
LTRTAFALVCALPLLAACGLQGDLKRPGPLWGNPPLDGPTDPRVIAQEEARQAEEDERERAERAAARAAEAAAADAATIPPPAADPAAPE